MSIAKSDVEAIVNALASKVRRMYVLEDVAPKIAQAIEEQLAAGGYDGLEGAALAESLTKDLRSVNGDLHLEVEFDAEHPTEEEPVEKPKKYNDDGEEIDDEGKVIEEEEAMSPFFAVFMEMSTYVGNGIKAVEVLPGNVGYLNISTFAPPKLSTPFFQHAMCLLQHTNALIIDIRENGGGDSSNGLLSYFTSGRTHYKSMYWRPENRTTKEYTLETVPGPRYNTNQDGDAKRPVFVLTSKDTFSSAEAFAFFMKDLGLATMVGETTAGGGHPIRYVRAGHDAFKASVSVGVSYSAKTGVGWEKIGVPADIAVAASLAKETAHLLGVRATLGKLNALEPASLSPAKRMLLKRSEVTIKELEEKLAKANIGGEPAPDASDAVESPSSESTSTPRVVGGRSEQLPPGVHAINNSDGTTTKIEVKERFFLGIKIRTEKVLKD
ncbi:ClpP/crotonase-like domain-containing protein [Cladochytrium replicatum]|nr:ClpP/crotonase-like domain-containing protein [Cladochytrium replicatum]